MNKTKMQQVVARIEAEHNELHEQERKQKADRRKKHLIAGVVTASGLIALGTWFNLTVAGKAAELVCAAIVHTLLFGGE